MATVTAEINIIQSTNADETSTKVTVLGNTEAEVYLYNGFGGRGVQVLDVPFDRRRSTILLRQFVDNDLDIGLRNLPQQESGTARIFDCFNYPMPADIRMVGDGPKSVQATILSEHLAERYSGISADLLPSYVVYHYEVVSNDIESISHQWTQNTGSAGWNPISIKTSVRNLYGVTTGSRLYDGSYLTCLSYSDDKLVGMLYFFFREILFRLKEFSS
jgi:hypothetical protein